MFLTFTTQQAAQDRADQIYADMLAANALEPGTARWDVPRLNAGLWEIIVNDRCRPVLTDAEVALFPEWQSTGMP